MNLGAIIIGFVAMALISGFIVFTAATQNIQIVDTYGNTTGATANTTSLFVSNVTAVGGTSTGFAVMIIAALALCAGVAMIYLYGKRY